jgi:aryl-alcohol dehydrogenase-like predicted oxidoreductase
MKRTLGRSGIEVSAMGLGCWAIGGPWNFLGTPGGWSTVDDDESIRALHAALELGVYFFDTAANYGAGHSERILARAFRGRRDRVVIATKFGYRVDEATRSVSAYADSDADSDVAAHLRDDVEASLRRLQTDYIDVYLLHVWALSVERALGVREALDALVAEGKVRTYGWSTDRPDAVRAFSTGGSAAVVQQQFSVLDGNEELLELCDELDLASMNRGPLGMGLLTGKYSPSSTFRDDDVRRHFAWHPGFRDGRPTPEWLRAIESVRDVLTSGGRTLAQGAIAWLWARSGRTVPIPGFRDTAQAVENCRAMEYGPLAAGQVAEIDSLLGRAATQP